MSTKRKLFGREGNIFFPTQFETTNKIPNGIYSLIFNHKDYRPEIIYDQPSFDLPEKLYGLDYGFIDRITTTFEQNSNNLGVLLTGYKGTGKTILCKYICNILNIPVIRLPKRLGTDFFTQFLSAINQDFILFVDEYEKKFKDEKEELLDVMDGMFNIDNKILFLLTSNDTSNISEFLINRPNRIHYIKRFSDLELDVINDIIDDLLTNKQFKSELLEILPTFNHITMDNLITIIKEINRFDCPPNQAMIHLNIEMKENKSRFGITK